MLPGPHARDACGPPVLPIARAGDVARVGRSRAGRGDVMSDRPKLRRAC